MKSGLKQKQAHRTNYFIARENCRKGCICDGNKTKYNISNVIWEFNQIKLMESRVLLTEAEKDEVMKAQLFSTLKQTICNSGGVIQASSQRFPLVYQEIFIEPETEVQHVHNLCEECWVLFNNHKGIRTYKNWKGNVKDSMVVNMNLAGIKSAIGKLREKQMDRGRYKNINEARKALEKHNLTEEQLQLAVVPETDQSMEAYCWLIHFFSIAGDYAPNRDSKVQLPGIYTKESIHHIYKVQVKKLYSSNEHEPLELRSFLILWQNVFPNVTISNYCQVSGKCFTCAAIIEREEFFKSEEELLMTRELTHLHKILIQMQRESYQNVRKLAMDHPELYMSLIIDGMSQDHCAIPYYGGNDTSSIVVKQKIMGAKQHGISKSFYRSFPHISGGCNLAVEVVMNEIEHRMDTCINNNECFPRYLFLQIDGGAENTAKEFYAFCEYLVREEIFDKVEVSRLPVGHTHEDIDAMFGVIWRAAQGKTIITPQQWEAIVRGSFKV